MIDQLLPESGLLLCLEYLLSFCCQVVASIYSSFA
ncbi:hypothetical protein NSE_0450 [Neorickettsia sennetsu str. Miyayama]|uniref:Uncharacterized protein n=1 Tax=Ehrlichia sennetsu (strain ATCC VR-367 / Miyayama) TaxID=222891 RepID=Q2GDW1_EHRS3|nr:hypothetical protein NSE_0450 [Neorickettsia sennetsu str. Miyayama]